MKSQFSNATEIQTTRNAMNGRLGEIITVLIGNDAVQKLYEGKELPADLAGKPVGEIALKMGVIDANTKTALLVAQAAERTLQLANKAEDFARSHNTVVKEYRAAKADLKGKDKKRLDESTAGVKYLDHPEFKFIGSERDPNILKASQGTMLSAQLYLNNEVSAINTEISGLFSWHGSSSLGLEYADGLREKAASFYNSAADMLKTSLPDVSSKLSNVAGSIQAGIKNRNAPDPTDLVKEMIEDAKDKAWSAIQADQQLGGSLGGDGTAYTEPQEKIIKLMAFENSKTPAIKPLASAPGMKL